MDDSEDTLSSEDLKSTDSPLTVKSKPKKRSLIERELETSLTARVTSPVTNGDGTSTSRYGRARRLKSEMDNPDIKKVASELKSPLSDKSPMKAQTQSPVYKMHASNSPLKRTESPKKIVVEKFLDDQIESIYQENISLSRFSNEDLSSTTPSPAKKFPKVYIRKDLIQKREPEDTVMVIQNMFSPTKSAKKSTNTHLNNVLERSSERYSLNTKQQNGYIDNSSVVKTLDFDSKRKKKEVKDVKTPSKSELFEMEAKCAYQVGDLAWARMGTYPFWPCIVTRDPASGVFVKKKLFGRIERDVIHVTFFGDNGRRGWIVDSMLRKYLGQLEFESTRDNFTPEDKKKDPRLYAAFFISEKKQQLWNTSVEEAEMLLREPKRLRIDIFNEMLEKSRSTKVKQPKSKISRTDSDVSLSESLYDSLFSEDDGKIDNTDRSKNRSRNKSLDMIDVVTACLDNMAAKTGITKIQRQSHMDRWLQKAKSKTPEKTKAKTLPVKKLEEKKSKKKSVSAKRPAQKSYRLRRDAQDLESKNDHDYGDVNMTDSDHTSTDTDCKNVVKLDPDQVENLDQQTETNLENTRDDFLEFNGSCDSETYTEDSKDSSVNSGNSDEKPELREINDQDSETQDSFATKENKEVNNETRENSRTPNGIDLEDSHSNDSHFKESNEVETNKNTDPVESDLDGADSQDSVDSKGTSTVTETTIYNEDTNSTGQDESSIETDHISQDTLTNREEKVTNLEENYEKTGDDKAYDDMIDDDEDDSDSERLPYSPLSNLGNNSDDNLSLDDVPFINETENDKPEGEKETSNTNEDLNAEIEKNYTMNESMEIDTSLTENNLENGHIIENDKSTEADIDKIRKVDEEIRMKNMTDQLESSIDITNNGYRGKNVREIEMAAKEVHLPFHEPKENGYHMNGDYEDTASIHSESSVTSTKSDKRKLRSKTKDLEDPEFIKYMELRQDALMDENPELSEKEIVAYLYKTWQYEESLKSDDKKNDDLRECNLVKGLNQTEITTKKRVIKKLSLNRNANKQSTLQRFLRRNKKVENDLDEEFYVPRKRGSRRNMIEDDDETNMEEQSKETANNVEENGPYVQESQCYDDIEYPSSVITESSTEFSNNVQEKDATSIETQNIDSITESTTNSENIEAVERNKTPVEISSPIRETPTLEKQKIKLKQDFDGESIDSEDSETPLIRCKLRSKAKKENDVKEESVERKIKDEDAVSIHSEDSEVSTKRKKKLTSKKIDNAMEDPEFVKYLELRQDSLLEEHPELSQDEIVSYLYQTYLYEENTKSELKKTDEIEQSTLVKGLNEAPQPKKVRRKVPKVEKVEKDTEDEVPVKDKPKRKSVKPFYNEEYSDVEEELEVYEIFKPKNKDVHKTEPSHVNGETVLESGQSSEIEVYDEVELYFAELTKPKPNIFKGLVREKVCEICEKIGHLVKCKGCNGMFHVDCVKKQMEIVEVPVPARGRRKKKKPGRKPKNAEDGDDDKCQDLSEENNVSIDELIENEAHTVDADVLEAQLSAKMKEILDSTEIIEYDSYSSDDCLDWNDTLPGKCEIIDVKLKPRHSISEIDYSDFKCNNCQKYNTPVCFVCKGAVSKKDSTKRQKCHVAHCHKYYHLECLDHWPQTQFNGGEPSKNNKKINEYFEALTCPRHVCHTCVSDDPRGCKTRFSGDKLARCVRCPATYHSFTKCLPAGTQILTASHIICPRHYEHRPGKVPCHVNTGWCFICALGGSLICCEYCPTSFHAECLNIDPPEGGYMCEDCETGRLPLYGEMVWVKLGHYRWWPGIILHPYEIPENLLAVKHSLGEFVVRFFGQYDHYWVNRGRVFPFQEGDSGRISSQKSKIDAAFTTAMEHAQRACEILKSAQPNQEESLDIASSLLPPHYVKLKVNKACGSLAGRRADHPESSLTQCDCNPHDNDPCGPYSQCLNRYLTNYIASSLLPPHYVKLKVNKACGSLAGRRADHPESSLTQCDCNPHDNDPCGPYSQCLNRYLTNYIASSLLPPHYVKLKVNKACGSLAGRRADHPESSLTQCDCNPHDNDPCGPYSQCLNRYLTNYIASSLLPPHYVKLKVNKACGSLAGRRADHPESSLTQCDCNPHDNDPCGPYSQCLNRMLLTECGPTCRAGDKCNNRAFEKRLYPKLTPYRTPSRGWGLKTLEDIKAGQFVIEYVGELIDEEEFRRRMRRKHEMRDENFYFLTLDKERMIDAGPKGNFARFMNHCCEPNCETQKWTVLGDVRVGLFALYDIPAHSEVTFNYNLECAGIDKKRCMCGAKRCSGYIGAKPKQDESQTKKNKLPGKRTYKKRKPEESPSTKNKPKRPIGRPPKPRELTEIEKDLLIIRNATNGISSDESSRSLSSEFDRNPKALKRKRVSFSTEEVIVYDGTESPNVKKSKLDNTLEGD
ncbi:uncharacterized protein LOC142983442 [Anticarsia gemmatalis]|uniref:uncharacterized protein LOC142983442 n=1 Tax=Anticarsia gemmatalis TaxID=129554 RepID=UPI003F7599DB